MAAKDLTTEDGVLSWLQSSTFPQGKKVTKVKRLTEGASGFVYRAFLEDASQPSVIVKHVESYAARAQNWKLDQNRITFEFEAMKYLSQPEMQPDKFVRSPELLFFDSSDFVLIMEDAGNLPSLKGWLRSGVSIEHTARIGQALGRFLARVHNTTAGAEEILSHFNGNTTAKYLSGNLYFGTLPTAAEKFGYTDTYFREAARVGQQEVDESNEVLTLGDFWTGNVLVNATSPEDLHLYVVDLELAKPGTAAFDIGQMAAEMYCLAAFRDQDLGSSLLNEFLRSYKENRQGSVDAAKVAIRIGVHLFVIMPKAWSNEASEERIKQVLSIGADLIRMGCARDEAGLLRSIVGPLVVT
ncbi:hypothetical protein LTR37_009522 [Vermiconidia calcicola]|uniref:Uncharacterized protein n=1 Tax=Vermiconidia calcicola TaxID=1690605 RepID=A0ACC3N7B0_9PEZI|nr:hypothetical protein LTR37_009522 [Vermiconidia calcicola]